MLSGILIVCGLWFLFWFSNYLHTKLPSKYMDVCFLVMWVLFIAGLMFTFAVPLNYYTAIDRKIEMETTQKVFDESRERFKNNESPAVCLEAVGITEKIAELNSKLAKSQYYATESFWRFFMNVDVVMSTKPIN